MSADYELPPRPEITPRDEPIEPGERAPDFTLPAVATDGTPFDLTLSEFFAGDKGLLVLYQDDGMPICTSELKAFAQEYELLTGAGVKVAALNSNGLTSHEKFQERDRFPFPLISDFHGDAIKGLGMWDPDERKSRRGVVVLGPGLQVSYVLPHFNPGSINAFEGVFEALGLA
jgi:peroxiredoxin